MKYLLAVLLLNAVLAAHAQDFSDPNLQSMIDAERAFIKMAREKNTRDAFLTYLSDHAVTFEKEPRVGKKHFETQIPNASWLYWQPAYCDISASGDFGFNTGPWELRATRTDERPFAFGHFVTIWIKQPDGQWKAAADIGISHPQPADSITLTTSGIKAIEVSKGDFHALTEVEEDFIKDYSADGNSAYKKVLSEEVRIYRTGKLPIISEDAKQDFFKNENIDVDFVVMGGSMARSKDMAYVYGTATIKSAKEGHISSENASYVRIWKKEDGNHWKIVLDILSQG